MDKNEGQMSDGLFQPENRAKMSITTGKASNINMKMQFIVLDVHQIYI